MNSSLAPNMKFAENATMRSYIYGLSTTSSFDREKVTWTCVTLVLCMFGAGSNLSVLVVITRDKKLRSGTGWLIGHLILTCFLMCFVVFPMGSIVVLFNTLGYYIPAEMCTVVQSLQSAIGHCTLWNEAFLALNRLVAIWIPQFYRRISSKVSIGVMVVICWAIGIVNTLPSSLSVDSSFRLSPVGLCYINVTGITVIMSRLQSVVLYGPITFVGVASLLILLRILVNRLTARSRVAMVAGQGQTIQQSQMMRRRIAVAKMLMMSFMWTIVCIIPVTILALFFPTVLRRVPTLSLWLRTCLAMQYIFNTCIYCAMSADYRSGLRKLWLRQSGDINERKILTESGRETRSENKN